MPARHAAAWAAVVAWLARPPRRREIAGPIVLMTLIFALSSIPGTLEVEAGYAGMVLAWVPPNVQNLLHVPLYAVLAFAWARPLSAWPLSVPAVVGAAFTAAAFYGLLDELHQMYVPGRFPSLTDCALNVLGAGLGVSLWHWLAAGRHDLSDT